MHKTNKTPRPTRPPEVLKAASEHLYYEIGMCLQSAEALRTYTGPRGFQNNLLVESLTMHTRGLIDFYFSTKPRADDMIAEDYFQNPKDWTDCRGTLPEPLTSINLRVGKEVAHLTYARLDVVPGKKGWHFAKISDAVRHLSHLFVNAASHSLLCDKLIGRYK